MVNLSSPTGVFYYVTGRIYFSYGSRKCPIPGCVISVKGSVDLLTGVLIFAIGESLRQRVVQFFEMGHAKLTPMGCVTFASGTLLRHWAM